MKGKWFGTFVALTLIAASVGTTVSGPVKYFYSTAMEWTI
jgi:hypothetical protein